MFRKTWLAPTIAVGILFGSSTSCSPPSPQVSAVEKGTVAGQQFSEDDRRAARLLSIGNVRALEGADSPLDQAVLCSLAIGEISQRLRTAGMGLGRDQIEAVATAQSIYNRKALAAARNAPADAVANARARLADANPEPSARAQIAISCLRKLT